MKIKTYKVYKITNLINNKIYFGYTSYSLSFRIGGHFGETRNTIISYSIRKYGKQNFTIELIEEHLNSEIALQREMYYINEFKTNVLKHPDGNGMNMTDGGEGASGYKHTKELRDYWSKTRKGMNAGNKSILWGKKGADCSHSKPVYVFTKKGILEEKFNSCREAAAYLKVHESNISSCCSGKRNTIKGKICQFSPEFVPRDLTRKSQAMFGSKNPRSKRCYLFDQNQVLSKVFDSTGEAARYLKVNQSSIFSALHSYNHKIKNCYLSYDEVLIINSKGVRKNPIYQLDKNNNVIAKFESIADAIRKTTFTKDQIVSGVYKNKQYGGFIWVKEKEYILLTSAITTV